MRVFLALLLSATLVLGQDGPIVSTENGKVQGAPAYSRDGRMYYSFKSIPYAKADRFQAPTVPEKWTDVKDATKEAPACIHYVPKIKEIRGQEDCLNVNVFTPRLPMEGQDKVLLPVIVYLHPGLNNFGENAMYDPKYFMDEDVVVVIPNYRLGAFGFLSTQDKEAQGNAGLRDQVAALKWIKENIEKFGGDKDSVTVLGSGSGGADAFIHTISPVSKGLINKVISMGGTTLSRFTFVLNPVKQSKKLGTQLGCPVDTSANLVSCLKGKDAKEILEKMTKLDKVKLNVEEKAWFGPTVDPILDGQTETDVVVPDNPVKLMKEGKIVNKVPLIIGGNEFEGINVITAALLKNETLFEKLDKKFDEIAPKLLLYKDTALDKDVVTKKVRDHYLGDKAINRDTFINVTNIVMDRYMGFGVVMTGKLYSNHAPVYMYLFSHKPKTTGLKFLGVDENYGMAHLDDVQYLFHITEPKLPFPEITKDHEEYDLSKNIVKVLSEFAETAKITKTWGEGKEWAPVDKGEANKWYKMGMYTDLFVPPPEHLQKRVGLWLDLYTNQIQKELETPAKEQF